MRIIGKIKSKGGCLMIEPFGNTKRLELDKLYSIDFKEYKKSRSKEQNNLMWEIITQIAKATGNDKNDIYIEGLVKAGASVQQVTTVPQAEDYLKRVFRAVKPIGVTILNGVTAITFDCYIGSSEMNVKEMTELIGYMQGLASEYGIKLEMED